MKKVDDFRSPDGVRAEIFIPSLGGKPILCIAADTPAGDAEVVLNEVEAEAFYTWLGSALGKT